MIELLQGLLLLAGSLFMFVAALGVVRLPDLLTRMHASTKGASLGVMLLMAGVALHFLEEVVFARTIAITFFVLMTAPVAAHAIGRAGYFVGIELWKGTLKDELRPNYNPLSHRLHSGLKKTPRGADETAHHEDKGDREES
ncbi:monovalent cation/H(+) antiporter subunit G [Kushneria marisflavi]|uniref:Na+/H+ antiporter subunit G n=1 Tax=Kushneria marisflavi TaxID=157779 RepID=A0A240UM27_9GAMM|nr:monovalent cation/H(+) antiporter subunit G [Kushneria marisflavi]ART62175.1 Na+/H+ antiporter subunit G [Kushneria marisflavi]RKD87257.1 multicomponent Na+:H+ antiporter subunit G [Kushneria marisflavi]